MSKTKKVWKDGETFTFKKPIQLVSEDRMIREVQLREPTVKDFNILLNENDQAKANVKLIQACVRFDDNKQLMDIDIEGIKIGEYRPLLDACTSFLTDTEE